MRLNKMAIFYKTCLIPFVIAFVEVFNQLAWVFTTFKTVRQRFFFDTILYFAFATMLRLSTIAKSSTTSSTQHHKLKKIYYTLKGDL